MDDFPDVAIAATIRHRPGVLKVRGFAIAGIANSVFRPLAGGAFALLADSACRRGCTGCFGDPAWLPI